MKLHATISFSSQGITVCIKDEPNTPFLRDGFILTLFFSHRNTTVALKGQGQMSLECSGFD